MKSDKQFDIKPNAIELYLRPTNNQGTWMVCGYVQCDTDPDQECIRSFNIVGGMLAFLKDDARPLPKGMSGRSVSDHANLVLSQIWERSAERSHLQLAYRSVEGVPGLSMVCGVLQNACEVVVQSCDRDYGVMLAGAHGQDFLALERKPMDLDWTRGLQLSQVHKEPVWRLGAAECWAARYTMAPEAVRAASKASALRKEMLLHGATPDRLAQFRDQNEICGRAIQWEDEGSEFMRTLRILYASPDFEDHGALQTAAGAEEEGQAMRKAIFDALEPDSSAW